MPAQRAYISQAGPSNFPHFGSRLRRPGFLNWRIAHFRDDFWPRRSGTATGGRFSIRVHSFHSRAHVVRSLLAGRHSTPFMKAIGRKMGGRKMEKNWSHFTKQRIQPRMDANARESGKDSSRVLGGCLCQKPHHPTKCAAKWFDKDGSTFGLMYKLRRPRSGLIFRSPAPRNTSSNFGSGYAGLRNIRIRSNPPCP